MRYYTDKKSNPVEEYKNAKKESQKLLDKINNEYEEAEKRGASKDELDFIVEKYRAFQKMHFEDFPV